MKSPAFEYHRPTTLTEAVELLTSLESATVIAGGQSLVPMLNFRLLAPKHLIDINSIRSLTGIHIDANSVRIGAMVRQRELEKDGPLALVVPIVREAVLNIGHRQTRNRGTIGGSLCHLDPSAELSALAVLMDATLEVIGPMGTRNVSAGDFIKGAMNPNLQTGELLVAINFPIWPRGHGFSFKEHARRAGDFALASASCLIRQSDDGLISHVAICVGGVGDRPVRLCAAERLLQGNSPSPELFADTAEYCLNLEADGSIHGSSDLKRSMAVALVRRALLQASERSQAAASSA